MTSSWSCQLTVFPYHIINMLKPPCLYIYIYIYVYIYIYMCKCTYSGKNMHQAIGNQFANLILTIISQTLYIYVYIYIYIYNDFDNVTVLDIGELNITITGPADAGAPIPDKASASRTLITNLDILVHVFIKIFTLYLFSDFIFLPQAIHRSCRHFRYLRWSQIWLVSALIFSAVWGIHNVSRNRCALVCFVIS